MDGHDNPGGNVFCARLLLLPHAERRHQVKLRIRVLPVACFVKEGSDHTVLKLTLFGLRRQMLFMYERLRWDKRGKIQKKEFRGVGIACPAPSGERLKSIPFQDHFNSPILEFVSGSLESTRRTPRTVRCSSKCLSYLVIGHRFFRSTRECRQEWYV